MAKRRIHPRAYTPATGKCQVVVFEAVFDNKDSREMEDVLDSLRQYGSAVIVSRMMVAEDFDTACGILKTHEETCPKNS